MSECPRSFCITLKSIPCSSRCVAKLCLSVCGDTFFFIPAFFAAFFAAYELAIIHIYALATHCNKQVKTFMFVLSGALISPESTISLTTIVPTDVQVELS